MASTKPCEVQVVEMQLLRDGGSFDIPVSLRTGAVSLERPSLQQAKNSAQWSGSRIWKPRESASVGELDIVIPQKSQLAPLTFQFVQKC